MYKENIILDLREAFLEDAKLTNADLRGPILIIVDLNLAKSDESIFNCKSLRTTNLTDTMNQFHIV